MQHKLHRCKHELLIPSFWSNPQKLLSAPACFCLWENKTYRNMVYTKCRVSSLHCGHVNNGRYSSSDCSAGWRKKFFGKNTVNHRSEITPTKNTPLSLLCYFLHLGTKKTLSNQAFLEREGGYFSTKEQKGKMGFDTQHYFSFKIMRSLLTEPPMNTARFSSNACHGNVYIHKFLLTVPLSKETAKHKKLQQ